MQIDFKSERLRAFSKYCLIVFQVIISFWNQSIFPINGITYSLTGGRFGDNVTAYCEARWISYMHGLEFYYTPFRYSEKLAMHKMHKQVKDHTKANTLKIEDTVQLPPVNSDTLITTIPFPKHNEVNFDDPQFLKLIQDEIRPLEPLAKIAIPKDHFSIALHVRRGGGWDVKLCQSDVVVTAGWIPKNPESYHYQCADRQYPGRFPPDTYYIEQLKYVMNLFPRKSFYVHIFTDDPHPEFIVHKYEEEFKNARIIFGYRKEGNSHDTNVIEDFFAMMEFDCLIRAASYYSTMVAHIGRIKLEIRPDDHTWEGDRLIITKVQIFRRQNGAHQKTLSEYIKTKP